MGGSVSSDVARPHPEPTYLVIEPAIAPVKGVAKLGERVQACLHE